MIQTLLANNALVYPAKSFQKKDLETFLSDLSDYFLRNKLSDINAGQVEAWKESFYELKNIFTSSSNLSNAFLLFEYLIPLGGNRRPDTIILHGETIYLVEFKNKATFSNEDVDQLKAYYNDLKLYHSYATSCCIKPILVLLRNNERYQTQINDMHVVSREVFYSRMCATPAMELKLDIDSFINASFKPILPIEQYAKQVFTKATFDNIETIQIENIEIVYDKIAGICNEAEKNKHHALILISGEPGSGKSALGLRLTHDFNGLYCSKNKKFIEYLHEILGHKVNITDNYSFIREYALGGKEPNVNFFVFDEAQRMWDGKKPKQYWNIDDSEQGIIYNSCSQKEWSVIVGLIGTGQQLGQNERDQYEAWLLNLKLGSKVYLSPELSFRKSDWERRLVAEKQINKPRPLIEKMQIETLNELHLKGSLRSFQNVKYNHFINYLLDWNAVEIIDQLKLEVLELLKSGFNIYVSRDLAAIQQYLANRYNAMDNSYCIIASPLIEFPNDIEISNSFDESRKLDVHAFLRKNGLPFSNYEKISSISPFDIQGLEVKMPVICWGEDMLWYNDQWNYPSGNWAYGNVWCIRNAYRVMLTRGRDGIFLYIPKRWQFNGTYAMFIDIGIPEL